MKQLQSMLKKWKNEKSCIDKESIFKIDKAQEIIDDLQNLLGESDPPNAERNYLQLV